MQCWKENHDSWSKPRDGFNWYSLCSESCKGDFTIQPGLNLLVWYGPSVIQTSKIGINLEPVRNVNSRPQPKSTDSETLGVDPPIGI